jgi:chromosome segregation ATPase
MADVKEMAIKQLEEKIAHLEATTVPRQQYTDLKVDYEEIELVHIKTDEKCKEYEEKYLKQRSININLDYELENSGNEVNRLRQEVISLGKELEHLRPLMVLYMKEKVE